ncbi:MAG: hypothetical protein ACOCZK_04400 [Planctomycetota bacterium]
MVEDADDDERSDNEDEPTLYASRLVDPAGEADATESDDDTVTIARHELRRCRHHMREFIRMIRDPNPDLDQNPTTAVMSDAALDHLARAYVKYIRRWSQ